MLAARTAFEASQQAEKKMDDHSNKLADPASETDPSASTFARDASSDLADRIYARDAGARPLSGSYDWQQHPSVLSDRLAEAPSDRLVARIYERDAAGQAGEPSTESVFDESKGTRLRRRPVLKYKHGPYQYRGKEVVIPRDSAQVEELTKKDLEIMATYLPPICVGSGKTTPALDLSMTQQSGGHTREQTLLSFAGRKPLLWGCLYVILLLISEALGALWVTQPDTAVAVVAAEGSKESAVVARISNVMFGFVRYGPGVFPTLVLAILGVILFAVVSLHLWKAYLDRRTCTLTYGFFSGSMSSFKQRFYVSVGFSLIAIGIVASCFLYAIPYLWFVKYAANLGLYCVIGGIWLAWTSWHPLETVTIDGTWIHFKGGRFLRLHSEFLGEMEKFPRDWEKSLRRRGAQQKMGTIESLLRRLLGLVGWRTKDKDKQDDLDVEFKELLRTTTTPKQMRKEKKKGQAEKKEKSNRDERIEKINGDIMVDRFEVESQAASSDADQIYEDDIRARTEEPGLSPSPAADSIEGDPRSAESSWGQRLTADIALQVREDPDSVELWLYGTIDEEAAAILGRSEGSLFLNSLTELSPAVAAELARHKHLLVLNGLTSLPVEVAAELARHKDDLWLDGLTSLSAEAAQALARHQGGIHLGGLEELDPDLAEVLATFQEPLELDGLKNLSVEVARSLAGHKESLALNGLTSLGEDVARALAGHVGRLDLDGLTSLSPEEAYELARHEGELELDGLKNLSEDVAKSLARNRGNLTLDKVASVTTKVAEALSQHQYDLDVGISELRIGHAKAFAKHQGNMLTLFDLTGLNSKAAQALAKYPGLLIYQSGELSPASRKILNDGGHF